MSDDTDNTIELSSLQRFAARFLTGRINWWAVPRSNAIINHGSIIGLVIYRKDQFQVELFIGPKPTSDFPAHQHPDVDVIEFALTGSVDLFIDDNNVQSKAQYQQWADGLVQTLPIRIPPTAWHSGHGNTPYAFLSIQHWLHNVPPSSVGLNWIGEPSSNEQAAMLSQQIQG